MVGAARVGGLVARVGGQIPSRRRHSRVNLRLGVFLQKFIEVRQQIEVEIELAEKGTNMCSFSSSPKTYSQE